MFAPATLPLQVTFLVLVLLAITLPLLLSRYTKNSVPIGCGICLLGSLPTLFIVGAVIDSIRYGEFQFDTAGAIEDGYVELPADATRITLHKYASGHELRFATSRQSLESWMEDWVERRSKYNGDVTPFKRSHSTLGFSDRFGQHGWERPNDTIAYRGWRAPEGAGIDVWYSDAEGIAFISDSYW
jgi:hypothetical protein